MDIIPPEILILIAEALSINKYAIDLERTCRRFLSIIRKSITRLHFADDNSGGTPEWLSLYKSIVDTDLMINMCCWTELQTVTRRNMKTVVMSLPDEMPELNTEYVDQLRCITATAERIDLCVYVDDGSMSQLIDGKLYFGTDTAINDLMLTLLDGRITHVIIENDYTEPVTTKLVYPIKTLTIGELCFVGVKGLSSLRELLGYSKLSMHSIPSYDGNIFIGVIKIKCCSCDLRDVTKIFPSLINLTYSACGPFYRREFFEPGLVVKFDDGDIHNNYLNHIEFVKMAYINLSTQIYGPLTYKVGNITVSNGDGSKVRLERLREIKKYILDRADAYLEDYFTT